MHRAGRRDLITESISFAGSDLAFPQRESDSRSGHRLEAAQEMAVAIPHLLQLTLFTVHALSGFLFYTGDIGTTKSKVGGAPTCDGREALSRRGWSSIIFQLYW